MTSTKLVAMEEREDEGPDETDHSDGTKETESSDWGSSDSGDTNSGRGRDSGLCGKQGHLQQQSKDLDKGKAKIEASHGGTSSHLKSEQLFLSRIQCLGTATQVTPSEPSSAGNCTEEGNLPSVLKGAANQFIDVLVSASGKDVLKPEEGVIQDQRGSEVKKRLRVLSSLLPKVTSQRDRFTVLEDTVLHLKNLQQSLSDLQQIHGTLKMGGKQDLEPLHFPVAAGSIHSAGNESQEIQNLKVKVMYTGLEDIAVTVKCKSSCSTRLISTLLRAIEGIQMEVAECSVLKSCGFFFCNAVCKWNAVGARIPTPEVMVEQLRTALLPCVEMEESQPQAIGR